MFETFKKFLAKTFDLTPEKPKEIPVIEKPSQKLPKIKQLKQQFQANK